MNYKFVKGVIDALGVKNVLNIEFKPEKTCNYNCAYCRLGRTNHLLDACEEFNSVSEIFAEIQSFLAENLEIDFIMLSNCGKYSLFSGFGSLAKKIRDNLPEIGIMTSTNVTMLSREEIQKELLYCNIIGCNITSVYDDELYLPCRPSKNLQLRAALDNLKTFSNHFTGMLIVTTEFVRGINDTEKNVDGLIGYLSKVQPNLYKVVGSKYEGQNLTEDFTLLLKNKMNDAPFPVTFLL